MRTPRLILVSVLASIAALSHAGILSYEIEPDEYDMNGYLTIVPAFDVNLGTLTSVRVGGDVSGTDGVISFSGLELTDPDGNGGYFYYGHSAMYDRDLGITGEPSWHDVGFTALPLEWGMRGFQGHWLYHDYTLTGKYRIELEYAAVPEPASMALLSVGALALVRRRKNR